MTRERIIDSSALSPEDEDFILNLRPQSLDEIIGQRDVIEKLRISIQAAKERDDAHEHTLFYGPPGLGKTTLAHIVASEMGTRLVSTSGPALVRSGDLMGILTNLKQGDVLFIDEIHRLPTIVEEFIYPAMEDFRVDFVVDSGPYAKTINIELKPFTLIGATTRAGLLTAPLRDRFGIFHHLDFYNDDDLTAIAKRSAKILNVEIKDNAAILVACRSRGTPRIANRLLRRVRDYTQVKADGKISKEIAEKALELEKVDKLGLDGLDRKFLTTIIDVYNGGPVGIETISATLQEEPDVLSEMVEPFLLKIGFLSRTKRGRHATHLAFKHLGKSGGPQSGLFEQ
jgi:Holliday junction DNA helicase RuvB